MNTTETWRPLIPLLLFLLLTDGGYSDSRQDESTEEVAVQELQPSHRPARRAATAVLHYLNYRHGSPNLIFGLGAVTGARLQKISEHGNKYSINFTVKDEVTSQTVGTCIGEVLFQKMKQNPITNVNCKFERDKRSVLDADKKFFEEMKKKEKPVVGQDIPDSFGHVEPFMEPVWHLAKIGSSYIMWKKSTEVLQYNMVQVKHVKQRKRTDNLIEFDFKILLHELPTQEIVPCDMSLVWHPLQLPKVRYSCTHLQSDGSGLEQVQEGAVGGTA
ncbi:latexin-like [Protopterus annectens]|uniref:latexin-like n=1 Tax=Protopterus annectens TaxID=7888 RepID=UPI001CFBEBD7|nr:latexin-like [Protopterus annectens]